MGIELPQCKLVYGRYFPFWDKLTDEQRERLCANTAELKYRKGMNIHGTDDSCTGAIMVISGSLRAYLLSENGKIFAGRADDRLRRMLPHREITDYVNKGNLHEFFMISEEKYINKFKNYYKSIKNEEFNKNYTAKKIYY